MSLLNAQAELAELIIENETQTDIVKPVDNLIIYQNNFLSNLISALKNTYPMVCQLVGNESFKALARDYIDIYPSSSGNLDDYGQYFSHFILQYQPASSIVYLADIAAFEWICHQLFIAADATPINPDKIDTLSTEDKNTLQFQQNPACQLMTSPYPILDIIDLCHGKINDIPSLQYDTQYFLIQRDNQEININIIDKASYYFLQALFDNQHFLEASNAAYEICSQFNPTTTLLEMIRKCAITDIIN